MYCTLCVLYCCCGFRVYTCCTCSHLQSYISLCLIAASMILCLTVIGEGCNFPRRHVCPCWPRFHLVSFQNQHTVNHQRLPIFRTRWAEDSAQLVAVSVDTTLTFAESGGEKCALIRPAYTSPTTPDPSLDENRFHSFHIQYKDAYYSNLDCTHIILWLMPFGKWRANHLWIFFIKSFHAVSNIYEE